MNDLMTAETTPAYLLALKQGNFSLAEGINDVAYLQDCAAIDRIEKGFFWRIIRKIPFGRLKEIKQRTLSSLEHLYDSLSIRRHTDIMLDGIQEKIQDTAIFREAARLKERSRLRKIEQIYTQLNPGRNE